MKHTYRNGTTTEYEHINVMPRDSLKPTVLYTHGFCSDPWGRKPEDIKKFCKSHRIGFFRYELAGHGSDAEHIEDADLNVWKNQILEIIDTMIRGPVIVVGASLGGWLSLLAARERPNRVVGVLGLAAAPDFTHDNIAEYDTPQCRYAMKKYGKIVFEESGFRFVVTKRLLKSGDNNLLLDKPQIPVTCPVVLVQGMKDDSVPYKKALKIAEKLKSEDVTVRLLKNSDHRLNSDPDAAEIRSALQSLIA
jgi:esterase/lipase